MCERDIASVMKAHVDSLMAIEGVVGVGLGELEDKTACIMVMLEEENDELVKKLPAELNGYPIQLKITGRFKAM